MALSSMGDSNRFYDKLKTLLRTNDLAFELDLSYFEHYLAFTPFYFSQKFIDTFGLPVKKGESLEAHHLDLVSAAQRIVEECVIKILRNLHSITGKNSILLAGGFFMNSVLNGKVHEFTDYTEAYLGGSPDDSGVSLGSAIYGYMKESGGIRVKPRSKDNFFGRDYSKEEIARELVRRGIKFREVVESSKLAAQKISEGQVVAWFHGASEFGQRALGHRSILGDPRNPSMKDRINKKVKYRETFRPFAPSILENFVHEYFDVPPNQNSFFMEKVFRFKNEVIGIVPAVVHADGTGRLQSVNRESNMRYYNLIEEFRKITGVPLVLNTSLNTNGVPLVESPSDALDCFFDSGIDCIFIEDFLIEKEN
jgi:carbamoyltransferase